MSLQDEKMASENRVRIRDYLAKGDLSEEWDETLQGHEVPCDRTTPQLKKNRSPASVPNNTKNKNEWKR